MRVKSDEDDLRNRPEWRGGATLRWQPTSRIDAEVNALFVGTVLDFAVPVGVKKLDSYARVDAALTYRVNSALRVFLSVENVFDEDYEEFIGFPAQGFTTKMGLRFSR